jgi:hypothetical protein
MIIQKYFVLTENLEKVTKTLGVFQFIEDAVEIVESLQMTNLKSSYLIECFKLGSIGEPISAVLFEPKNEVEKSYL